MTRTQHQYFSNQYQECLDKSLDWKILVVMSILFIRLVVKCWIVMRNKLEMGQELYNMIVHERMIKSGLFSDFSIRSIYFYLRNLCISVK